ncbi:MAG: hypothetical protein ACE5E3_02295 [Mariprofundus sp.]
MRVVLLSLLLLSCSACMLNKEHYEAATKLDAHFKAMAERDKQLSGDLKAVQQKRKTDATQDREK